ncbi:hypothetical protein LINPERPRIM_LOCUS10073 [Linum perenne]
MDDDGESTDSEYRVQSTESSVLLLPFKNGDEEKYVFPRAYQMKRVKLLPKSC